MSAKKLVYAIGILAIGFLLLIVWPQGFKNSLYSSQAGQALPGLTAGQLQAFQRGKTLFEHEFTADEGLGPLYNGRSCFECHGRPAVAGGAGQNVAGNGLMRIGSLMPGSPLQGNIKKAKEDVDAYSFDGLVHQGGSAIQHLSVTEEFPANYPLGCKLKAGVVPASAQFVSWRYAGSLLGAGLIDAIDEQTIVSNMIQETRLAPELVGHVNSVKDPLTATVKIGRFGLKAQQPNLLLMVADEQNTELGITSFVQHSNKSATGYGDYPKCILETLPPEPNDRGDKMTLLAAFLEMLAPPSRPVLTPTAKAGSVLFEKLKCAVCHTPELTTASEVAMPDPDSPFPTLNYVEMKSLENQPAWIYSDLLLHDMGPQLADGIAQASATGGQWRTAPLWGLRYKKHYLHDGRAPTIEGAILAHGGQAEKVRQVYADLPSRDKKNLLEFLGCL